MTPQARPSQANTPRRDTSRFNRLFYGDNLDILRKKIEPKSVDLCYIDPPFNSKRNYFQIYNNQGSEDRAQAQAFMDTWEWGEEAVSGLTYITDVANLQNRKLTEQTVELIRGLHKVLKEGDLLAYLIHMTLRIVEIHRILKPTGSFYLHFDPTASHYLKLLLDSVFCADGNGGEFLNEIIWWYDTGGMAKTRYSRKHDVIFIYAKSHNNYTFNVNEVKTLKNESQLKRLEFSLKQGENSTYRLTDPEKYPHDVWQLHAINPKAKERLGYPTQKPEALLERVIKASSNEGDVVLDSYCGCGTTVAVAQRLNRQWIGIDITYQSISLILKRLEDQYPTQWADIEANILLDGVPRDLASAIALANRKDDKTRKEFEKWAVLTFSKNQARVNEKKGADGGVDGVAFFMVDKDINGRVIFQVKSGGVTRATVATLNSDRQRENAEIGILITMDDPTKAMKDEVRAAGRYKHPLLNREDDRIQIVTVEEILAGRKLDLPMGRNDAVKSAKAVEGEQKQMGLI